MSEFCTVIRVSNPSRQVGLGDLRPYLHARRVEGPSKSLMAALKLVPRYHLCVLALTLIPPYS